MDSESTKNLTVAFLGTGQMGTPMASRLIAAGFNVRVWNRSTQRVQSLVLLGGVAAATPAAAANGADLVVTMLPDGPTIESVIDGEDGAFSTIGRGAIWLQMGTIGVEWTTRLGARAMQADVLFVDAPVSGSVGPATAGELIILASGPLAAQPAAMRAFDALGRETFWLGAAGAGSRAKLVLNNWLVDLVEMVVETLKVAEAFGLDPHVIIDILADAPIGSPYAVAKARSMLEGDFSTNFALKHAVKDALLMLDAAKSVDVNLALTAGLISSWQRAIENGAGDLDLSAVYRFANAS
jgi:3-hydroxyisobutyrate dehydrogenase